MVADEEEVVTAPQQSAEVSIRNYVPTENADKYLGWEESRYVQQGVPGALESDYGFLVFFDLLLQGSYGIDVDFPDHFCSQTTSGVKESLDVSPTHADGDIGSRFGRAENSMPVMRAEEMKTARDA